MPMRFLLALIVCVSSATASAEELNREEINKLLRSVQSVPIKHNGKDGVWFSANDAEALLSILETKLPAAFNIIDEQSKQIALLESSIASYKASNEQYKSLVDLNRQMFDTAMKYLPDLNPPQPAWYETPKATYIYGIITGAVIIVGSAWVLDSTLGDQP